MAEKHNNTLLVDDYNSNNSDSDSSSSDSSDSDAIDERLKAIVQKRLKEKGDYLKSAKVKKIQRVFRQFQEKVKEQSKSNEESKSQSESKVVKKNCQRDPKSQSEEDKKYCQRDQSPEPLFPEDLRYKLIHNRNKAKKE